MKTILCVVAGLFLAGCASTATRDMVTSSGNVVLVSDLPAVMRGQNIGTTVFQNGGWESEHTNLDLNGVAVQVLKNALIREIDVMDGRELGLLPSRARNADSQVALTSRLTALGRETNADVILVLAASSASDWLYGTNQPMEGVGYVRREFFGMRKNHVFGVLDLRAFNCQTGRFVRGERELASAAVHGVEWHDTWDGYTEYEKRILVLAWEEMLKEHLPLLLTKAGLANAQRRQRSLGEALLFGPNGR